MICLITTITSTFDCTIIIVHKCNTTYILINALYVIMLYIEIFIQFIHVTKILKVNVKY